MTWKAVSLQPWISCSLHIEPIAQLMSPGLLDGETLSGQGGHQNQNITRTYGISSKFRPWPSSLQPAHSQLHCCSAITASSNMLMMWWWWPDQQQQQSGQVRGKATDGMLQVSPTCSSMWKRLWRWWWITERNNNTCLATSRGLQWRQQCKNCKL